MFSKKISMRTNKTLGIIIATTLFTSILIYFSSFFSISNAASTTLSFTIVAGTGNINTGNNNTGNNNTGNNGNNGGSNNGNHGNNNTGDSDTGSTITGSTITTGYINTGNLSTGNINTGYIQTGENIENNINNASDKNKTKEDKDKDKNKTELELEKEIETKDKINEGTKNNEIEFHGIASPEGQDTNRVINVEGNTDKKINNNRQGYNIKNRGDKVEEEFSCEIPTSYNNKQDTLYQSHPINTDKNKESVKEEKCIQNKGFIEKTLIKTKIIKEKNIEVPCNTGNKNTESTLIKSDNSNKPSLNTNNITMPINVFYSLKDIFKPISNIFKTKDEFICLSGEYLDYNQLIDTKINQIFTISSPTFKIIIKSIITHLKSFR